MKTTKFALAAALGLIALVAPNTLRADPITYSFAGTLQSAVNGTTSVTGTFTLDSSTGQATDWQMLLGSFVFNPLDSAAATIPLGASPTDFQFAFFTPAPSMAGSPRTQLALTFTSTAGFASLTFQPSNSEACFDATPPSTSPFSCLTTGSTTAQISSFTAGTASPVPEPTTFILLGTGLVGLMGMGWRRKRLA